MKLFGLGSRMAESTRWIWVLLAGNVLSALTALAGSHPLDQWQRRNTGAQNLITALTYDSVAGRYVAVDEVLQIYPGQVPTPSALLLSTDGANWDRQVTGTNQLETSSIASRGGQYFTATYSRYSAPIGYLSLSTNGMDWIGESRWDIAVKSAEIVDGKVALSGVISSDGFVPPPPNPFCDPVVGCVSDPGSLAIWISGQDGIALSVPPFGASDGDSPYIIDADFARGNGTWVYTAWIYWATLFSPSPSPVASNPLRLMSWSSRDGQTFLPGPDLYYFDTPVAPSLPGFNFGLESTPGTSVVFAGGQFVAVNSTDYVLTSSDGIAWQPQFTGAGSGLQDIAYGAGQFVAVGTGGGIVSSTDGVHWTKRATGEFAGVTFRDVEFGHYNFVVTGWANGTNVVVQSGPILNLQMAMEPAPSLILSGPALSRVRIEATSDPSDVNSWTSIETVVMETDPYRWVDPRPASASRFYRAALE